MLDLKRQIDNIVFYISCKFFYKPKYYKIKKGFLKDEYLYMSPRHGIGKIFGIYEPELTKSIISKVHPGSTCLDVGSQIGYFSLLFAKLVGKNGTVIAFDPMKNSALNTERTLSKSKIKKFKVYNFGLGEKNSKQKAFISEKHDTGSLDNEFSKKSGVNKKFIFEIKTLDSIFNNLKINKIDYIKVDIEGSEYIFVMGALNTIKKLKPDLFVEMHTTENYKKIYKVLKDLGYNFYDLKGNKINLKSFPNSPIFHCYATCKK